MLNQKRELFAQTYIKTGNASEAYRTAYPGSKEWTDKTVWAKASEMCARQEVKDRIAQLAKVTADKACMTKADVLREAMRLAKFDIRKLYRPDGSPVPIHELDDETAAAVQAVDILEEWDGTGMDRVFVGYTKKYKIADKNSALDKLFKHFGLFEEDNKQKHTDLTDDELRKRLRELTGGKS